jgi:hypothetical protein
VKREKKINSGFAFGSKTAKGRATVYDICLIKIETTLH